MAQLGQLAQGAHRHHGFGYGCLIRRLGVRRSQSSLSLRLQHHARRYSALLRAQLALISVKPLQ